MHLKAILRSAVLLSGSVLVCACATASAQNEHVLQDEPQTCDAILLDVHVKDDGQLLVNGAPADREVLRDAAQRKARACEGQVAQASLSYGRALIGYGDDLETILREELPQLNLGGRIVITSGGYRRGTPIPPPPSFERLACDALRLDVVVNDDDIVLLNGRPSSLEAVRLHARNKAVACEGVVPTGTLEGPNRSVSRATAAETILDEELPGVDLDYTLRVTGSMGLVREVNGSFYPVRDLCDAVPLNIVVIDDETMMLNGEVSDWQALRDLSREKAEACRGVAPTGTYEARDHSIVAARLPWVILNEELPDLEMEMIQSEPGGRD